MNNDVEALNLKGYETIIAYEPMNGEVDYKECPLVEPHMAKLLLLPQSKDANPLEWGTRLKKELIDQEVCLLIPGRRFDKKGTRHGRGFGWYDRFLYSIPRRWVRIGVTDTEHFFEEPLPRQDWDEPMDYVLIKKENTWQNIETNVRLNPSQA